MLRSVTDLKSFAVRGTDSPIPIGHVRDVYFDDECWVVRYFVVETGTWLDTRKVLISPLAVREARWEEKLLRVGITAAQVRASPDIDTDQPVSRQQERDYTSYYGYPLYWERAGFRGGGPYPDLDKPATRGGSATREIPADPRNADSHLRSANIVGKYQVHATDGEVGHAREVLIDERTWTIRFLDIQTGGWWFGHDVLMAPEWIERVSWAESAIYVDLTRAEISGAPTYQVSAELDPDRMAGVHAHDDSRGYWTRAAKFSRPAL
jgi:uncharacterized protein YrrD